MNRHFVSFRNALAFCSRIVPPAPFDADGQDMAKAVPWYPAAGITLGAIAALPAMFLPQNAAWISAWSYVLLLAWLTRGLHWDGLADLADACGSNATGERFWEILKDSRIGAFGVMALLFGVTGMVTVSHEVIKTGQCLPLILAPAFGRSMVIALGKLTKTHPASRLATLTQPGTHGKTATLSFAAALVVSCAGVGLISFLSAALFASLVLVTLGRIARNHGGSNGDFYGTAIITGEIALLLGSALQTTA